MKKKIIYTLLFLLAIIIFPGLAHAAVPTLEQIRDAYNANTQMTVYATLMEKEFIAATDTTMPNALLITIGNGQMGEEVDFTLANNILSNTNLEDSQMIATIFLADAIGKIYGYNYGDVFKNIMLLREEYMNNVNLEEDGIEIRENNDGSYSFKIDISKKIQLQDLSDFYIKPSMIIGRDDDENVTSNEMGNYVELAYRIYYNDDNTEIYVGEVTKLTNRAYKSIQSIIEALFSEDEVEYFTSKYPKFKEGLHQFDGFEIETNVNPKADDAALFDGMKVVKLVIEDDEFEEAAANEELETVDHGEKTIVLDFTKNESFVVPFTSTSKDSDAAFLIKYLLNPL